MTQPKPAAKVRHVATVQQVMEDWSEYGGSDLEIVDCGEDVMALQNDQTVDAKERREAHDGDKLIKDNGNNGITGKKCPTI